MIKLAITNPKGGTGKSTTSVNFAALSARAGYKTLLIDLDTQQSCSLLSQVKGVPDNESTAAFFQDSPRMPSEIAIESCFGYDIVPATGALNEKESWIASTHFGEFKLKTLLRKDEGLNKYDVVLFDTPGFRGRLLASALMATDSILIPLQASEVTLDDLRDYIVYTDIVSEQRQEMNSSPLEVKGIMFIGVSERTRAAKNNIDKLKQELAELSDLPLLNAQIPFSTRVEDAHTLHAPVVVACGASKVADRYKDAFKEVFGLDVSLPHTKPLTRRAEQ